MEPITVALAASVVRPRKADSYKGDYGRVVIVGGNALYGGAVIMAAQAAVAAGAGLVSVVTAGINRTALHARLPEAMVLDWTEDFTFLLKNADVVVVGPGLGLEPEGQRVLTTTLTHLKQGCALVIDGSAITLWAAGGFPAPPATTVWTPHAGEWQRLSGLRLEQQTPSANQQAANRLPGVVVVKGHRSQLHGQTVSYQNTVGTPAMATGGSGDTLTGVIAAFIAQFGWRDDVVAAAVFVHSAVAEELAANQYVVLPSQVARAIPRYMTRLSCK